MPAKKTTKATEVKGKTVTKAQVKKAEKDIIGKAKKLFSEFEWENNIHTVIGIILLVLGLWQLWEWVLGLILLVLGLLFLTGYFSKDDK